MTDDTGGTEMKRKSLIAAILATVVIILSGLVSEGDIFAGTAEETAPHEETDNGFTGTWQLSIDNDRETLDKAFPDIFAFGSELTIRPDGKIFWHIGAAGAAGEYEYYDDALTAVVSDIMEPDEYRIAVTKNDNGNLIMKYKSIPLEWTFASESY